MSSTAKWLVTALVASLGINLFVLGAWAGKIARDGSRHGTERVTLGPMTDSLSPEGRQLLRKSMDTNHKEAIPIFRQLIAARDRATAALDAEPYDADNYAAALRDIRTYSEAGQTLLHATLVDVVGKLSPADRHRLAQEIRHRQYAGRPHGDGKPLHKDKLAPPPPN